MTEKISYTPYQDYNMEHEMLVDSRFYDMFTQKMDEIIVSGRLAGYQVDYESKDFFEERTKQRTVHHHINFKVNNNKVFMLNLYTSHYGTRYHDSSIHHFSGGNHNKHKETLPIFFDYFSNKEHFKKGFEWVSFKNFESLIIGLIVFKHVLQKIRY